MALTNHDAAITVAWQGDTGLPEDQYVNSFAAQHTTETWDGTNAAAMLEEMDQMYMETLTVGGSMMEHFSVLLTGRRIWKLYDLSAPSPRVPLAILDTAANAADIGSTTLPTEVALCISFHADIESGDTAARRKGRIFLGPLADHANIRNNTTGRPSANMLTAAHEFGNLVLAAKLDGDVEPCVWSRADDTLYRLTGGWIDNAWDTQRRRGLIPTSRDLFPS